MSARCKLPAMDGTPPPGPKRHPLNVGFEWIPARREGARRLTPAQLDAWDRDGFVKVEGAFSAEEIAAVTAAIDPLEQKQDRWVQDEKGGQYRLSHSGVITFTIHLVARSPVLAEFAAHPAIKDICHDLIGDDVRVYWDQSVYKKTQVAQEFPWHQDNGYTFTAPQQYVTIWIPLVDVDEENGCPWIAPGTHRLGTLEHWTTPIGLKCLEDVADAVSVPAKAGDAIVFSSLAPHRTGPNLVQGSVRKAYILQYAPEGAVTHLPDGSTILQDDPGRQFKILDGGR